MKENIRRGLSTFLFLALLAGVFFLEEGMQPEKMEIPVTQVFSYAPQQTRAPTPLASFRQKRDQDREKELAALTKLAESGDETAREYLLEALSWYEKETAVEGALAAAGCGEAVCDARAGAVTICVTGCVDADAAQSILEIAGLITEECAENVFLLDETGYSW